MPKVLIVAYHFPPAGGLAAAGSQRMLKLVRHLPSSDWQPLVLTVRPGDYEDYLFLDNAMLRRVPEDLSVIRTGVLRPLQPLLALKAKVFGRHTPHQTAAEISDTPAEPDVEESVGPSATPDAGNLRRFKDALTDLFEIPDEASGWILPAVYQGTKAARENKVDLIFATGRPWSTLVVGALLKMITGKPFVVDFRDPWMTNPFRPRYSSLKDSADTFLEAWVVRRADLIVANTKELSDEFAARFGEEVAEKCITARNGFDPEDFASAQESSVEKDEPHRFSVLHTGALYGKRDPAVLLEAMAMLSAYPDVVPGNLVLSLVGPIHLTYDINQRIRDLGIEEFVDVLGGVTHAESLAAIATCGIAVLLQPGTGTQVPSKLYEYIGCGKKVLAIANEDSGSARLVVTRSLGQVASPDDPGQIAKLIYAEYIRSREAGSPESLPEDLRAEFDFRLSVASIAKRMSMLETKKR